MFRCVVTMSCIFDVLDTKLKKKEMYKFEVHDCTLVFSHIMEIDKNFTVIYEKCSI